MFYSWAVLFLSLTVLAACGGGEFSAFPDGPQVDAGHDVNAVDHYVGDAKLDVQPDIIGRDVITSDVVDASNDVIDAGQDVQPDVVTEVGTDAQPDVVAEVSVDAKPDVVADAKPDVIVDAGHDADLADASPEDVCQTLGVNGWISVIVNFQDSAPNNKVLGVFGKSTIYGPDGGSNGYEIWKQASDSTQHWVVARPIQSVDSAMLLVDPGFAAIGEQDFSQWVHLCPSAGCLDSVWVYVCEGKTLLGTVNGLNYSPPTARVTIVPSGGPWGITEIKVTLNSVN